MGSQTSPIVNIGTLDLSKEINRERKREEFTRSLRPTDFRDDFQRTASHGEISSAGEPTALLRGGLKAEGVKKPALLHESLKESKTKLTGTVREAIDALGDRQPGPEEFESNLFEIAEEVGASLREKVAEQKDKKGPGATDLSELFSRFEGAREEFLSDRRAAWGELVPDAAPQAEKPAKIVNIESASPAGHDAVAGAVRTLERFGIVTTTSGTDVRRVLSEADRNLGILSKRHASQGQRIKFLEGERKRVEEILEHIPTAEGREIAERKLEELNVTLQPLLNEQSLLNGAIREGRFTMENAEKYLAEKDLGAKIDLSEERSETLTIRSQSASEDQESPQTKVLRTASATEGFRDSRSEYVAPNAQTVGLNAANDFSGTILSIASVGSSIRSEAKKTDQLLKKLLAAALAGNFEAVKSALILLSKRSGMIMTQAGAQAIKAMQFYEKSMAGISKEMGKLKGGEANYGSSLAKMNSDMNLYSMNRQAITNTLRDIMSMDEEMKTLVSSVLQQAARTAAASLRGG